MPYSCNNKIIILLQGRIIAPSTFFFPFFFFFIYVGGHILLTLQNNYTIEEKLPPSGVFTIIFLKNNIVLPNQVRQQIGE
jgi:hypothetical protein